MLSVAEYNGDTLKMIKKCLKHPMACLMTNKTSKTTLSEFNDNVSKSIH